MSMFNGNKPSTTVNPNTVNIINNGTTVIGDVNSEGDMRVDGTIKGYISSKARLVLGPTCNIEGDVKATNLEISGFVNGNIIVSELLTVKSTAKIQGDIISGKLIIEAGAEFNGKCSMREAQNSIRKSEQASPKAAEEKGN